MTFIVVKNGKIKILLSSRELRHSGIKHKAFTKYNPAQKSSKNDLPCVIPTEREVYTQSEKAAFDFENGVELLRAVKILYDNCDKNIKSNLYEIDGMFRLILAANTLSAKLLREFCCDIHREKGVEKTTYKYGRPLSGNYAIREIGENL